MHGRRQQWQRLLFVLLVAFGLASETAAECPAAGPVLNQPAAGSQQSSPVTFTWERVSGAIEYRFVLLEGEPPSAVGLVRHSRSQQVVRSGDTIRRP